MQKPIGMFYSMLLVGCLTVAGLEYSLAQEPASQDNPAQSSMVGKKAAVDAAPTAARDSCGGSKDSGSAKTADSTGGDVLKAAPAEGETLAGPPAGGGGGARGRRGGLAAGAAPAGPEKLAYDYELPGADGKGVPFCSFKGKTVLIVNLARNSSYNSQLPALEKLSEQYKDKGLVVIGVPSNEFGAGEPGADADIQKVYTVENKVTFPVMAKSEITGDKALPFFDWLTKANGGAVHWNFTKFFIDKNGKVVARFDPAVAPDSVEMQAAVLEILAGTYKAPGTGDAAPSGRRGGPGMMAPPMN